MFDYFDEEASWPERQVNLNDMRSIADRLKEIVYRTGSIEDLEDQVREFCIAVDAVPPRGRSVLVGAYVA